MTDVEQSREQASGDFLTTLNEVASKLDLDINVPDASAIPDITDRRFSELSKQDLLGLMVQKHKEGRAYARFLGSTIDPDALIEALTHFGPWADSCPPTYGVRRLSARFEANVNLAINRCLFLLVRSNDTSLAGRFAGALKPAGSHPPVQSRIKTYTSKN